MCFNFFLFFMLRLDLILHLEFQQGGTFFTLELNIYSFHYYRIYICFIYCICFLCVLLILILYLELFIVIIVSAYLILETKWIILCMQSFLKSILHP